MSEPVATTPPPSLDLSPVRVPGLPVAWVAFAAIWMGLLAWWHRRVTVDDPWITYRYAANLLEGHGLVFNPGEYVEGFSNPTWVLASAMGLFARVDPLDFSRLLSAAMAVGMLVWFASSRARGGAAAALLLAAAWPVAVWVMGGLETILHATLVLALVFSLARAPRDWGAALLAGGLSGALAASRPEGFAWLLLPMVARWAGRREPGESPARMAAAVGIGWVCAALVLLWRSTVYGAWLPNTVSAKVGGGLIWSVLGGLGYLIKYGFGMLGVMALLAAWGAIRVGWRPREGEPTDRLVPLAVLAILMQLGFTVAVGGDWMPGARFLVPVLPLICMLGGLVLARWLGFVRAVTLGFFLLAGLLEARQDPMLKWCRYAAKEQAGELLVSPLFEVGTWLRDNAPDGAVFAASEAGVMPYVSGLRFIDMLGLVDPHIASLPGGLHQKHDAGYVLGRRPEYIVLGITAGPKGTEKGTWAPDQEILAAPAFASDYAEVHRVPRRMPDVNYRRLEKGWMVIYQYQPPAPSSSSWWFPGS